jgi:hypothetical protein
MWFVTIQNYFSNYQSVEHLLGISLRGIKKQQTKELNVNKYTNKFQVYNKTFLLNRHIQEFYAVFLIPNEVTYSERQFHTPDVFLQQFYCIMFLEDRNYILCCLLYWQRLNIVFYSLRRK